MVAGGYPQFSHPSQIAALARRHPSATLIATHGGQINISGLLIADALIMLRSAPNIIINTSGVYREDYIEDCVSEFGAQRVIFGSGSPVFDQAFETLRLHKAHLADEIKQQIGWDNIARLVG
jgi:predicted TIM-barrel fold metal-dependent hydrolase